MYKQTQINDYFRASNNLFLQFTMHSENGKGEKGARKNNNKQSNANYNGTCIETILRSDNIAITTCSVGTDNYVPQLENDMYFTSSKSDSVSESQCTDIPDSKHRRKQYKMRKSIRPIPIETDSDSESNDTCSKKIIKKCTKRKSSAALTHTKRILNADCEKKTNSSKVEASKQKNKEKKPQKSVKRSSTSESSPSKIARTTNCVDTSKTKVTEIPNNNNKTPTTLMNTNSSDEVTVLVSDSNTSEDERNSRQYVEINTPNKAISTLNCADTNKRQIIETPENPNNSYKTPTVTLRINSPKKACTLLNNIPESEPRITQTIEMITESSQTNEFFSTDFITDVSEEMLTGRVGKTKEVNSNSRNIDQSNQANMATPSKIKILRNELLQTPVNVTKRQKATRRIFLDEKLERRTEKKNSSVQTETSKASTSKFSNIDNSQLTSQTPKKKHNMGTQTYENDFKTNNTVIPSLNVTSLEKHSTPVKKSPIVPLKTPSPMKQLTISQSFFSINSTIQQGDENVHNLIMSKNQTILQKSPCKETVSSEKKVTLCKLDKKLKKLNDDEKKNKGRTVKNKKESKYSYENHQRVCENVTKIVRWVFNNEYFYILFTKKETDLLRQMIILPEIEQKVLCIRLFTRKPKWYNLYSLCKELNLDQEGIPLKHILKSLTEKQFIESDYSKEPVEILLNILPAADLGDICSFFKLKIPKTKHERILKLLYNAKMQCTLSHSKGTSQILREKVCDKLGICIKLHPDIRDILNRVHLLYSLTNSDLENANDIYNLMNKLQNGLVTYPKVQVDFPKIFESREEFLNYAISFILRKEFQEFIEKKDIHNEYLLCKEAFNRLQDLLNDAEQKSVDSKKPLCFRRFSASWVYCSVVSAGSQNLGKRYPKDVCQWLLTMLEQSVYCNHKRGLWYIQLSLIQQAHLKDLAASVQSIVKGMNDKSVSEVCKRELSIRGSKFKKCKSKVGVMLYDNLQLCLLPEFEPFQQRIISANVVHNNKQGRKIMYKRHTENGQEYSSVEETAISSYKEESIYENGIHCEGALFKILFYILFWDIIFQVHVPNTFVTEIQCLPLDLYSGDFYSNRLEKITSRLEQIRNVWSLDMLCSFVSTVMKEHSDELHSVINDEIESDSKIHIYIRCIGKKLLAAVCERLAKDYKQFLAGLPDLFLWNSKEFKSCFVEVKSEKDKLSTNQILWLNYLRHFGANVEVCHVKSIGSKRNAKQVNYSSETE